MTPLGRHLAGLSASEMVAALGLRDAPSLLRRGLKLPFYAASRSLGEALAELDSAVPRIGLPRAAELALRRLGVTPHVGGAPLTSGPWLVLANHPGAYDALTLMWALSRRDLLILAADRTFLRALGGVSEHLVFVGDAPAARAGALKRALGWLKRGGALLHFPAGAIEPDADFEPDSTRLLGEWQPGVSALVEACARASGSVAVAGVRGVHSPRAKRLLVNRLAERRGITTLSPLVQLVGGLRDVQARVHLASVPLSAARQAAPLRAALLDAIQRASSAA